MEAFVLLFHRLHSRFSSEARERGAEPRNNGRIFREASVMAASNFPATGRVRFSLFFFILFFRARPACPKAETAKIWPKLARQDCFTGETDKTTLCPNEWRRTTKRKESGSREKGERPRVRDINGNW